MKRTPTYTAMPSRVHYMIYVRGRGGYCMMCQTPSESWLRTLASFSFWRLA